MNPITCIIVDDEKGARSVLNSLISNYFPQLNVIAEAKDVLEAVKMINELKPQVVFLDVQMPDYAGYEIIDFFDDISFEIIFVTAFDNYAIRAFEMSAIDYLVKPINRKRLKATVDKVTVAVETFRKMEDYKNLLSSIKEDSFDKLILPELGSRRVVDLMELIAIEASGSYTIIHLRDNQQMTISKNLRYFEELLAEKPIFFRSHRSWLINLESIESLQKTELIITHTSGLTSNISRRKLAGFYEVFHCNS